MGSNEFIDKAKEMIVKYSNNVNDEQIDVDDVYVVWLSKTLQNNKAMLSTTVKDSRYYEVTGNGSKEEIYLDAYKKEKNIAYKL